MICVACGCECHEIEIDEGIGRYEYWGMTEVHHDYRKVSACCHEGTEEGGCSHVRATVHTSRKEHKGHDARGREVTVNKGDQYRLDVYRSWRQDGPGWIWTTKTIIAKAERSEYA
jgi:hypothetical protein